MTFCWLIDPPIAQTTISGPIARCINILGTWYCFYGCSYLHTYVSVNECNIFLRGTPMTTLTTFSFSFKLSYFISDLNFIKLTYGSIFSVRVTRIFVFATIKVFIIRLDKWLKIWYRLSLYILCLKCLSSVCLFVCLFSYIQFDALIEYYFFLPLEPIVDSSKNTLDEKKHSISSRLFSFFVAQKQIAFRLKRIYRMANSKYFNLIRGSNKETVRGCCQRHFRLALLSVGSFERCDFSSFVILLTDKKNDCIPNQETTVSSRWDVDIQWWVYLEVRKSKWK